MQWREDVIWNPFLFKSLHYVNKLGECACLHSPELHLRLCLKDQTTFPVLLTFHCCILPGLGFDFKKCTS